jgi:hypothetical protein
MQLHVGSQADLSTVADEACRRAAALVEGQMGVELVRPPQARLHYKELRVGGAPPQPAQPAATASASEPAASAPAPPAFTGWERLPTGPTATSASPPTAGQPQVPSGESPEQASSDEAS